MAPGSGARLLGSEVLPTPPKGQPRDPAAAWQALDGYPGKILVVSDSFIAGGGDGCAGRGAGARRWCWCMLLASIAVGQCGSGSAAPPLIRCRFLCSASTRG